MAVTISGSGPVTGLTSINSTVSDTELGYLDGATSNLQTQLNKGGTQIIVPSTIAYTNGTASVNGNLTSFAGVNGLSLNDVFSSSYDNYRIMFTITSGNANIGLRFRVSGSDNFSSQYLYNYFEANFSSSTTANQQGGGTATSIDVGSNVTGYASASVIDVFGPYRSDFPSATTHLRVRANSGTAGLAAFGGGLMTVNTSYTGFTIFTSNGSNMDGAIRVYGYRN